MQSGSPTKSRMIPPHQGGHRRNGSEFSGDDGKSGLTGLMSKRSPRPCLEGYRKGDLTRTPKQRPLPPPSQRSVVVPSKRPPSRRPLPAMPITMTSPRVMVLIEKLGPRTQPLRRQRPRSPAPPAGLRITLMASLPSKNRRPLRPRSRPTLLSLKISLGSSSPLLPLSRKKQPR